MGNNRVPADKCVHCHICMKNCKFLSKYGLDIGDTDRLRELAYHCFLCGECTRVCPIGIDGRAEILDMRRDAVASDKRAAIERNYKGLLGEKKNYKFRNYRHLEKKGGRTVFMPGCNFPSLYPKTAAAVSRELAGHGIQTIYECCGKPVSELGFKADEDRIICEIRSRLESMGVTELVLACPNCREFFGDRLGIKITGIYTKLAELGIGRTVTGSWALYTPCPDRDKNVWVRELDSFVDGEVEIIRDVQCCGLGGCAISSEPEIAAEFTQQIAAGAEGREIMTYCASCVGRIKRNGYDRMFHVLTRIMGTDEEPDTGKSYINRVLTRFK